MMTKLGVLLLGVIGIVLMAAFDQGLLFAASNVAKTNYLFRAIFQGVPAVALVGVLGGTAIAYARSRKVWTAAKTAVLLCLAADALLFLMVVGLGTAGV